MKRIVLGILILAFNSCHFIGKESGIKVTITNKSATLIENIRFTTSENLGELRFDKIEPHKSVSGFLSMKDTKSDGDYVLEFARMNSKKESKSYGYYTNGVALDSCVEFSIEKDTVIGEFSGMKY